MRLDEVYAELRDLQLTNEQINEVWNIMLAIIHDVVDRVFDERNNARRRR